MGNRVMTYGDWYHSGSGNHTHNVKRLGEGWVGEEALAIGIYAALAGGTFPEVFAIGANHEGDSDSTASMDFPGFSGETFTLL